MARHSCQLFSQQLVRMERCDLHLPANYDRSRVATLLGLLISRRESLFREAGNFAREAGPRLPTRAQVKI